MIALFIILATLLVLAAVIVPVVYMQIRNRIRDDKNIERGLKMVPLLIHLPPPSDDTETSGRDVRDVIDENISKAQIIYNIIASTLKKGRKMRLHGQRHFSFEVVGSAGFVHFYASVPLALVDVVKQAVVSAYPSARLEEVADHNIFSPTGKIDGTVGGELELKESFAYPIATYQEIKRDAMQALLNALSGLEKQDGAAIQILMRPADSTWRKNALSVSAEKRKGKSGGGSNLDEKLLQLIRDFFTAFVKPPEKKDDSDKKDLSSLDQAIVDSIEDKTRHAGYETLIRVVASSETKKRAEVTLNNIVAAFSLFDAPGKNGFKYSATDDIESFVTGYILRFFPQSQTGMVLNSVELATIFHFPDQRSIPTSQLERQGSKQVDAPRNMPEKGLLLGYNIYRGVKKPVRLDLGDRQRHMYAVGQTGTGKSTFLENLALQDMLSGGGFAFIDPHGDTAEQLLAMVPRERTEDVIYFSPADTDYPLGLNLFEYQTSDQKDFIIQEVMNMLYKLYDPQRQGIVGPRYEHMFRNAALAIMADPNGGTFIDIPKLFRDPQYVQQKLQHVKDQNVLEFWQKEMPQSQRSNDFGEVVSWFVSKFGAFLSNEMMRNIIGQTKSAFDLRDVMDNGKILLVNLSKGRLGELNSKLLGMIFVMKFQAAAMSRASIPESERRDFALYVDEFQNFSTDSFATIMSEARKYHLNLIVANQFTTQLTEEIRDAVFGNMGTIVAFRIGQPDVESLSKYFHPYFDGNDLLRIPNHNTIIRTLVGGVPTQPFSMATLPPLGKPNQQLATALKQLSAAKYGRPKSVVEAEVFERLATKPNNAGPSQQPSMAQQRPGAGGMPSSAGFGSAPASPFGQATQLTSNMQPPAPKPSAPGSFLDEWLQKKDKPMAVRPSPWSKGGPAQQPASGHQAPAPAGSATPAKQQPSSSSAASPLPPAAQPPTPLQQPPAQPSNQAHQQPSSTAGPEPPSVSRPSRAPEMHRSSKPEIPAPNQFGDSGEFHIRNNTNGSHHTISIDREGNINHHS
jgi:hypothetical protein